MKPLKLRLKNFIGIRSGLNRDELELDLSLRRGLVALIGPNGHGKTTILDSLHPYRIMPFRSKGYTERQTNLYDETYGEAEKELVWEHGEFLFRSLLLIHGAGKTKKTEAYLFYADGDGRWQPYELQDGTKCDGKAETYDRAVHSILGDPEMFFTAIFAAQERKRFSDYDAGDIKLLLSDLLVLERYLKLSAAAAERAKLRQAEADNLQPAVRAFEQAVLDVAAAKQALEASAQALAIAEAEKVTAQEIVSDAHTALAVARSNAANREDIRRRRTAAQQLVADIEQEGRAAAQALQKALTEARTYGSANDVNADIRAITARLQGLRNRLAAQEARAAQAGQAEAVADELRAAQQALDEHDQLITDARIQVEALAPAVVALEQARARKESALEKAIADGKSLKSLETQAELVKKVPCAGMDINSTCLLLADARKAGDEVPRLQTSIAQLRTEYTTADKEVAEAEKKAVEHADAKIRLRDLETGRQAIARRIQTANQAIQAAAAAVEILASIETIKADIAADEAALAGKQALAAERAAEGAERAKAVQADHDQAAVARSERLQRAKDALAAIPPDTGEEEERQAQQRLQSAQVALAVADKAVSSAQQASARAEASLAEATKRADAGKDATENLRKITDDVAYWRLTAKGLGRDGVVALAIDDAGPSISDIANDLLLRCYGPRFTVRFDTQSETAKGVLKEDFDIIVYDGERGDSKSVTKMSGGERIWINDAITRAIAIFLARESGRRFKATFSDESDGGLDTQRKAHSFRMKKHVMEIAGYEVEFCVTHTKELWEMADSVINVAELKAA